MTEKIKMLVCKLDLRPQAAGGKLIKAGTPFPEEYVVESARKKWLNKGILTYTEVEAPVLKEDTPKPTPFKKTSRKTTSKSTDEEEG